MGRRETNQTIHGPDEIQSLTLKLSEFAYHMRRSRAWAYQAAKDGRIPVVHTPAGIRVRTADLMAMIGATK